MQNKSYPQEDIPDKLYFRIGELSRIAGVPAYVLRFWETEFKGIKPKRSETGRRQYRKKDVELVLKIKYLLYTKKFTIPGARQHLKKKDQPPVQRQLFKAETVSEIRNELVLIRKLLD